MKDIRVFSYRRFSSGRQARGTSLERQTKLAQAWCQERGYDLDESLSLSDLGVSAFKGDNATRGALGGFIAAIEAGKVPKGSILLVESLDRLSRATLPEAVSLLMQIVKTGVRVVSMVDGKEWNSETINDTMSFMLSVLLFSRAHEESSTKAKRVSAAFQTKRNAGLAVVSRMHGSGWMQPKADKSGWELIHDKAESVRKVFELAASGKGGVSIARIATEEGWVMPWRERKNTGKGWEHTGISRLLRDRRVLGEWQPMKMVNGTLTPDGDPVQNYFPAAVSEELWHRVQVALKGRTGPKRLRGINADVFAGLLYCKCGERMERKAASERGYARYYCLGTKAGRTKCPSISELGIVHAVLSNLGQFEEKAFRDDTISEAIRERIRIAEEREADAKSRAERIILAIEEGGNSTLLLQRLSAIEAEAAKAKSDLESAREELMTVPKIGGNFGTNLVEDAMVWINDKEKTEERFKLSDALRRVVDRIVFNGFAVMIFQVKGVGIWQNIPQEFLGRAKRRDAGMSREEVAAKARAM